MGSSELYKIWISHSDFKFPIAFTIFVTKIVQGEHLVRSFKIQNKVIREERTPKTLLLSRGFNFTGNEGNKRHEK
jgi:hypothetical protein